MFSGEEEGPAPGILEDEEPQAALQLGARGRRQVAKRITREANIIRRCNKVHLKVKTKAVDRLAKRYDDLPRKPEGHFSVCPGHPWAKIHHTHQTMVVYRYVSCMRCGKVSHTLNAMSKRCKRSPASKHAEEIIYKMSNGRNPYAKPWPPDNRDYRSTFPCYKLQIEARTDNDKAEPFIYNRDLGDPGDYEVKAPRLAATIAIAKRKHFASLRET